MIKIKKFQTKTINIELDKLKLDLTNARFQHLTKKVDDAGMDNLIWNEPSTGELFEQIKSAGGLYEEPILNSDYTVLEGNRRIVCLRHLQAEAKKGELPNINKNAFDIVKCRIIPEGTTALEKQLFLAAVHVIGKQPWPAFNKAKQINDLYKVHNLTYDQLAKHLNMGKITVIRMMNSYEQTDKYGKTYSDDTGWYRKYSYFEELFKSRDLKEFTKLQKNIDKFAKWVYDEKFSDVRDVRWLGKILKDEDALHLFETKGFDIALELIKEKNPILKSKEFKQIQKTIDAIRSFPRKELIKTIKDPRRREIIMKLKEEIDSLVRDIESLDKE